MIQEEPSRPSIRVGGVISQTFGLAGRNGPALLMLAALSAVLSRLVNSALFGINPTIFMPVHPHGTPFNPLEPLQGIPAQLIEFVIGAAMVLLAYSDLRGPRISIAQSLTGVLRLWFPITVLGLIMSVAGWVTRPFNYLLSTRPSVPVLIVSAIALIAGVIFLFVVLLGWWLAVPAVVVENRGPLEALRRSWTLTRGHKIGILFVGLSLILLFVIPMWAIWALGSVGIPPHVPVQIWTPIGVASVLLTLLVHMTMNTATAVVYANLRDTESMDGLNN